MVLVCSLGQTVILSHTCVQTLSRSRGAWCPCSKLQRLNSFYLDFCPAPLLKEPYLLNCVQISALDWSCLPLWGVEVLLWGGVLAVMTPEL